MTRAGCCETWPKPCSYHEGWADAEDSLGADLAEAVALLAECHPEWPGRPGFPGPEGGHAQRVWTLLHRAGGDSR